ncbi:MAG: phage tail tape measure protein [Synergistaceae bacterium]|nr:phage tail tape measure protein [Synergistaceae bacterium]
MTNTSISTLGESFKKFAPYAKAVSISLKQSAAMIGIIGNAGIKGSAARTAVTSAIRRLAAEPKKVLRVIFSVLKTVYTQDGRHGANEYPQQNFRRDFRRCYACAHERYSQRQTPR